MTSLREIVATHPTSVEELPLVHTTQRKRFDELRATNELSEPVCNVFNESIVYLFYGRPAYRALLDKDPGAPFELYPICLVFRPHTVSRSIKRVFVCDSGAVDAGLLEPDVQKNELSQLELEPGIESAQRLVSLIYGTNKNYFGTITNPYTTPSLPTGEVAERWFNLVTNPSITTCDDRMSAIEVQVNSPVSLLDSLLYVVLPSELLEDADVRKTIFDHWNCDPLPYDVYRAAPVHEYYSDIRRIVREQFERTRRL